MDLKQTKNLKKDPLAVQGFETQNAIEVVLYDEVLLENQMINSNKYCSQLDKLKALDEKHPELVNRKLTISHQDNIKLHASLMTRQKLSQFGWEVLTLLPYSPYIAPSDFHLFWPLRNSLNGKKHSIPWNTGTGIFQKIPGTILCSKMIKSFGKMEL